MNQRLKGRPSSDWPNVGSIPCTGTRPSHYYQCCAVLHLQTGAQHGCPLRDSIITKCGRCRNLHPSIRLTALTSVKPESLLTWLILPVISAFKRRIRGYCCKFQAILVYDMTSYQKLRRSHNGQASTPVHQAKELTMNPQENQHGHVQPWPRIVGNK